MKKVMKLSILALATACGVYIMGSFVSWSWVWPVEVTPILRFWVLYIWVSTVAFSFVVLL